MTYFSDFDLDYSYGSEGERIVDSLLIGGKTVEVKRDRRWSETGNIYVETECCSQYGNWYNSGITVSKADYYAFVLEELILFTPTEILRTVIREKGRASKCHIPPNFSKGYLIRVSDIVLKVMLNTGNNYP